MNWMQTLNGTKWNLMAPRTADVDFREIAHALSVLPRFLGHTTKPYSVAEHSCHVHDYLDREGLNETVCLWGLLHDAHEAFTGDLTTPLKAALIASAEENSGEGDVVRKALKDVQARQDDVIFAAAGLTPALARMNPNTRNAMGAQVKAADRACLVAERHAVMGPSPAPWDAPYEGVPDTRIKVEGWTSAFAARAFLRRLDHYGVTGGRA
jgi:5'-deoxynucleotidase YfbR-like HD superfamily hydrolase